MVKTSLVKRVRENLASQSRIDCEREGQPVDSGFVTVVIVMLMLILITIVGIASMNMTITENMIVRSAAQYSRNFYLAESAGYEAAQRLENTVMTDTNPTGGVTWIMPLATDMTDRTNWISDGGTPTDYTDDTWTLNSVRSETFYTANPAVNPANLEVVMPGAHTRDNIRLSAHFKGVVAGSSLKVTGAGGRLYGFSTYGMYSDIAQNEGEVLIEMGYRKRF